MLKKRWNSADNGLKNQKIYAKRVPRVGNSKKGPCPNSGSSKRQHVSKLGSVLSS